MALTTNPIFHACIKHVELHIHVIREKIHAYQFVVQHIPSIEQPANIFTNPLPITHFIQHHVKLNVHQILMSLRWVKKTIHLPTLHPFLVVLKQALQTTLLLHTCDNEQKKCYYY